MLARVVAIPPEGRAYQRYVSRQWSGSKLHPGFTPVPILTYACHGLVLDIECPAIGFDESAATATEGSCCLHAPDRGCARRLADAGPRRTMRMRAQCNWIGRPPVFIRRTRPCIAGVILLTSTAVLELTVADPARADGLLADTYDQPDSRQLLYATDGRRTR
jgi:hypothetical protein